MLYAPQYLCAMSNTAYMSGVLDGGSEHYTETLETLRSEPTQAGLCTVSKHLANCEAKGRERGV